MSADGSQKTDHNLIPTGHDLIGGRLLARNTVWNLTGQVLPFVVALFVIPLLIKGLGADRFGLLSLAWMFIGYFSLFDFGLGRALTQLVAEKSGQGLEAEIPSLIRTSCLLMLVFGMVGAFLVFWLSPILVKDVLRVSPGLYQEAISSFRILSLSLPFVVSAAGLRGALEARQRFDLINFVRIPLGILVFAGPAFALIFSSDLSVVVTVLVISRIAAWFCFVIICGRLFKGLYCGDLIVPEHFPSLLRFGGWMTVSNVVGPLMVYLDRFLIGAVLSMTAVAYYVTPYEVATKILIVPGALVAVLFPAFSSSLVSCPAKAKDIFSSGISMLMLILFPVILLMVAFAPEGLSFWVGEEFSRHGTLVLRLLLGGVFVNAIAMVPFALIQGRGRPDITAKLHLLELSMYLFAVWMGIRLWGIVGAAVAWSLRALIDMALLLVMARRFALKAWPCYVGQMFFVGIGLLGFAVVASLGDVTVRVGAMVFMLPLFLIYSWFFLFTPESRHSLQAMLGVGK